jgi:hypothetical protein
MPISEKLAAQALTKIREQEAEINDLRKRLSLGSAIQKSLESPATGNGRNRLVSDIVRKGLFQPSGSKPVTKATRVVDAKDRRDEIIRERNAALGIQNAKRGR